MKNYNQVTIPAGILMILIGFVAKFLLPPIGINVPTDWLAFFFFSGISFILLSIQTRLTIIVGFALLAVSLFFLLIALL
jgi:hypothetical protein